VAGPWDDMLLQGATPYSLIAEPEPVMASDGDFDRRITKDEAIKAAKTRFALLTDKDGDLAGLPKTPARAASARRRGPAPDGAWRAAVAGEAGGGGIRR
jgi:hypothetical protein